MKQTKWILTVAAVTLLSGVLAGCVPSGFNPNDNGAAAIGESTSSADTSGTEASQIQPASTGGAEKEMGEENEAMRISVEGNGHTVVFQLVDNSASRSLYEQLPLEVEVQDYSDDEKIFYPPEELDISDADLGQGPAGSLAYFSAWGNVIMYYDSYGPYNGLYELGTAISGSEFIETMSGTLQIEKAE